MKHCVSSYADLCINGTYRVFAVQDTQHGRSTLGIYLDAGTIGIDQHRGRYNGRVAGEVMAASEKLCGLVCNCAESQQGVRMTLKKINHEP